MGSGMQVGVYDAGSRGFTKHGGWVGGCMAGHLGADVEAVGAEAAQARDAGVLDHGIAQAVALEAHTPDTRQSGRSWASAYAYNTANRPISASALAGPQLPTHQLPPTHLEVEGPGHFVHGHAPHPHHAVARQPHVVAAREQAGGAVERHARRVLRADQEGPGAAHADIIIM